MGIDALAAEIIHQITSFLEPIDIASFRTICRRLASVCTPEIPELTIYHSRESLENAVGLVTSNKKIASTVKTICYQADRFGQPISYERWDFYRRSAGGCIRAQSFENTRRPAVQQGVGETAGPSTLRPDNGNALRELGSVTNPPGESYSSQELQNAYETYRGLCSDQYTIDGSDYVTQQLTTVLSACTACEAVIVSVEESKRSEYSAEQPRRSSRSCRVFRPSLVYPAGDPDARARSLQTVSSALLAIDASGRSIRNLTLPGTSYKLFYQSTEAVIQKFNTVASHLTRLVMDMDLFMCPGGKFTAVVEAAELDRTKSRFHAFLASASNMREVALGVHRLHPADPLGPLDFHRILGSVTWPHLTVLWLTDFYSPIHVLLSFLRRHDRSLRSLRLDRVRLTFGTWLGFFSETRDILSRLDKLRLRGELVDMTPTTLVMSEYWSPAQPSVIAEAFEGCCLRGEDVYKLDVKALLKEHRRKIVDRGYETEWFDPQGGDFDD